MQHLIRLDLKKPKLTTSYHHLNPEDHMTIASLKQQTTACEALRHWSVAQRGLPRV